jgi:hypothetical protein
VVEHTINLRGGDCYSNNGGQLAIVGQLRNQMCHMSWCVQPACEADCIATSFRPHPTLSRLISSALNEWWFTCSSSHPFSLANNLICTKKNNHGGGGGYWTKTPQWVAGRRERTIDGYDVLIFRKFPRARGASAPQSFANAAIHKLLVQIKVVRNLYNTSLIL